MTTEQEWSRLAQYDLLNDELARAQNLLREEMRKYREEKDAHHRTYARLRRLENQLAYA